MRFARRLRLTRRPCSGPRTCSGRSGSTRWSVGLAGARPGRGAWAAGAVWDGNPGVRLLVPSARVRDVRTMGEGKHARFSLHSGSHRALGVAFGRPSLGVERGRPGRRRGAARGQPLERRGRAAGGLARALHARTPRTRELAERGANGGSASRPSWPRDPASLAATGPIRVGDDRPVGADGAARSAAAPGAPRGCGRRAGLVGRRRGARGWSPDRRARRSRWQARACVLADTRRSSATRSWLAGFEHVVLVDPPRSSTWSDSPACAQR